MAKEINFPQEGMLTLGATFTKSTMDNIISVIQQLVKKGWKEKQIVKKMNAELFAFDEHTRRLLMEKAMGRRAPDDIADKNVVSVKELKAGTIEVAVRKPVAGVQQTGLLRFRGEEWYIGAMRPNGYVLKRLV